MQGKLPSDTKLAELYVKKKLTLQQIGQRYGVTRQRVQQRLARIGVRGRREAKQIDREVLRSLYVDKRYSQAAIGIRLGVSEEKVRKELRRLRIKRPRMEQHIVRTISRAEIERVYITDGLLQPEAAKELGVTVENFRLLLRHHRITYRHFGIPYSVTPRR